VALAYLSPDYANDPKIIMHDPVSDSLRPRRRVETFRLYRDLSGYYTFRNTIWSLCFDSWIVRLRSESRKRRKADLSTFCANNGG